MSKKTSTNPYWEKFDVGYSNYCDEPSFNQHVIYGIKALRWDIQKLREELNDLRNRQCDPYALAGKPLEEPEEGAE